MKSPLNKNGDSSSAIGTIYSYSTLKSMTKDDLIDLLRIAQHNYECSQNGIYNITEYAKKLDKALDKACECLANYEPIYEYKLITGENMLKISSQDEWKKFVLEEVTTENDE